MMSSSNQRPAKLPKCSISGFQAMSCQLLRYIYFAMSSEDESQGNNFTLRGLPMHFATFSNYNKWHDFRSFTETLRQGPKVLLYPV